jgi:hypothetical protein
MLRRAGALLLAVLLLVVGALPAAAYHDFEAITSHVNTYVPQKLNIARPSGEVSTSESYYYVTGSSNPKSPLYLDGQEVTGRACSAASGYICRLRRAKTPSPLPRMGKQNGGHPQGSRRYGEHHQHHHVDVPFLHHRA